MTNSWTLLLITSLILLTVLPSLSDQLQADSVHQSFNAFAAPLDLKLSWPKTKLQNVGAGDPPSTILIDGVRGVDPGVGGPDPLTEDM